MIYAIYETILLTNSKTSSSCS